MKHLSRITIVLLILNFYTLSLSAATIEFPKEELAKESVLPVFEGETKAVISRRVETAEKIELGLGLSFIFNEPFFESMAYKFHGGYHLDSFHSFHLNFVLRQDKLSSDAGEIDSKPSTKINFNVVPIPKYFLTLDYQLTPYYGKISFTKNGVSNLSLYGILGIGAIDVGGETTAIGNLGVGTNLYVTSRIAIKADLRFLLYQGPNVLSRPAAFTQGATEQLKPSDFDSEFQVSPSVSVGATILL